MFGIGRYIKNQVADMLSSYYLRKVKCGSKIKVAFLVTEPSVWDKQELVFKEFKYRKIDTDIIVLPKYNLLNEDIVEYDFFSFYSDNVIRAYDGGDLIDLKKHGYTHVFYPTPYNEHYPISLRSKEVAKYAKVCYIAYGYTGSDIFDELNTNEDFFRYVSYAFMTSDRQVDVLKKRFKRNYEKGLQNFCNLGYPVLEYYSKLEWKSNYNNILWTPRWSYDDKVGGSHFFELKDKFIDIVRHADGYSGTIRPHPLMFTNFIKMGKMSEIEKDAYLNNANEAGISLSCNKFVEEDYRKANILITDFSSIIIMYMLTGKPIIYCESQIKFNESYSRLKEGMYIARNVDDVSRFVKMIISGKDPKKEIRKEIAKLLKEENKDATKNIVDCVMKIN